MRRSYAAEGNPAWKGGKLKKICYRCEKEFWVFRYRDAEAKFCSRSCIQGRFIDGLSHTLEYNRKKEHKRRAIKRKVGGDYSLRDIEDLIKNQENRCIYCTTKLDKYEIDHKIPLARGGSNWPSNLQLLCASCNRKKHTKTHGEFLRHLQLIPLSPQILRPHVTVRLEYVH